MSKFSGLINVCAFIDSQRRDREASEDAVSLETVFNGAQLVINAAARLKKSFNIKADNTNTYKISLEKNPAITQVTLDRDISNKITFSIKDTFNSKGIDVTRRSSSISFEPSEDQSQFINTVCERLSSYLHVEQEAIEAEMEKIITERERQQKLLQRYQKTAP